MGFQTCLVFSLEMLFFLYTEVGGTSGLGHIDVDISEAGGGWGDDDIVLDEGQ